jgi:hypothetical protein
LWPLAALQLCSFVSQSTSMVLAGSLTDGGLSGGHFGPGNQLQPSAAAKTASATGDNALP